MFKFSIVALSFFIPYMSFASVVSDNYSKDGDFAKSQTNAAIAATQTNSPQSLIPDYTATPPEASYYTDPEKMKEDGQAEFNASQDGQAINNQVNGSKMQINLNSDSVRKSINIINGADDIARGRSTDTIQCVQKQEDCTEETETKTCEKSNIVNFSCILTLKVVNVNPDPNGQPVFQDEWSNSCSDTVTSNPMCHTKGGPICTSGEETKNIDAFEQTRSCWEKKQDYTCEESDSVNSCEQLDDGNCQQTSKKCTNKIGDFCLRSTYNYSCKTKSCAANGILCGSDFFCENGDCSEIKDIKDGDFDKDVAEMAVAGEAGRQANSKIDHHRLPINKQPVPTMFGGSSAECRKDGYGGFSNCCSGGGWGQDIGLAHCNDEEKELGKAKSEDLVVYIGKKCTAHYPWPFNNSCSKHEEVYCTFPDVMSYIVETQGRQDQLHKGFGSPDSPNCHGITPDELDQINFDLIDMSRLYGDVESAADFPSESMESSSAQSSVDEKQSEGAVH